MIVPLIQRRRRMKQRNSQFEYNLSFSHCINVSPYFYNCLDIYPLCIYIHRSISPLLSPSFCPFSLIPPRPSSPCLFPFSSSASRSQTHSTFITRVHAFRSHVLLRPSIPTCFPALDIRRYTTLFMHSSLATVARSKYSKMDCYALSLFFLP